jgi:hypothetical protein
MRGRLVTATFLLSAGLGLIGGNAPAAHAASGPLTAASLTVSPNPSSTGQSVTFSWTATGFPNYAAVSCSDNRGWLVNAPYTGSITKLAGYDYTSSFTWTVTCTDGDFYGTGSFAVTYSDAVDGGGDPFGDGSDLFGNARCNGNQYSRTWHLHRGTWPYQQDLYLHALWCGYPAGAVTYVHTWVTTNSYLCSASGNYTNIVSGGVGYGSVTVEGGTYFACPTSVPWWTIHRHRWMQIQYYGGGGNFARHWG